MRPQTSASTRLQETAGGTAALPREQQAILQQHVMTISGCMKALDGLVSLFVPAVCLQGGMKGSQHCPQQELQVRGGGGGA